MRAGQRAWLITVQRATVVADDYGGETETWTDLEQAWAQVKFGLASEKRQAAETMASQTATFEVVPTPTLLGTTPKDRISFDGDNWNITEVAPLDLQTLRFTAVRSK